MNLESGVSLMPKCCRVPTKVPTTIVHRAVVCMLADELGLEINI